MSITYLSESCTKGTTTKKQQQLYEDTTPTSLFKIPNVDSGKLGSTDIRIFQQRRRKKRTHHRKTNHQSNHLEEEQHMQHTTYSTWHQHAISPQL